VSDQNDGTALIEVKQQLIELRRHVLDARASSIDRWLTVIGLVLAVFAVAIPVATYIGFNELRQIGNNITGVKTDVDKTLQRVKTIEDNANEAIQTVNALSSLVRIDQGKYDYVSTGSFRFIVVQSGQVTEDQIDSFLEAALRKFSSLGIRNEYSHRDRWDVQVGGGRVFINRTSAGTEFATALEGVRDVLNAIMEGRDLEGVRIMVRGTGKFFDIEGIDGLGSRAWIGFDLR